MLLQPYTVNPERIADALNELESAIAGVSALLPLPPHESNLADALRAGEEIADDVALVVATSGSTGTPKGALLTPANLVSSADATHQVLGGEGSWLLALPPHHIAGIQVLIRSLIAGYDPVVQDVRGGFHVADFAALTHRHRPNYTSLVPMQLMKAMDTLDGIEALRTYDAILVGGAALPQHAHHAAKELGITVVTTYGSSETSGGCIYDGHPIPGAQLKIIDERIYLGGPMIAKGYRNPITPNPFQDGWFATSDSGFIADGRLQVTGRIDSIIDTGGLKVHPEVIEKALLDLRGVDSACVVGIPDERLGQAVVAAYSGSLSPAAIIEGLEHLPRWQLPKQLKHCEALPTTGPGKVDRRAVARLF